MRNKKDLVKWFVDSITAKSNINTDWHKFIAAKKTEEFDRIILEESLASSRKKLFVEDVFRDSAIF